MQDHGRRREYPTLGGVLAPSQADLPPRDIIMMMRGERLESRGFFSKQRGVTRSQPGLITPRHARRTTGVTGVFLDAEHAPKEFCLSLAAVQPTSLSHAASTQLLLRPIGGWNSSTESLCLSRCSQCFILAPEIHSDGKVSNRKASYSGYGDKSPCEGAKFKQENISN